MPVRSDALGDFLARRTAFASVADWARAAGLRPASVRQYLWRGAVSDRVLGALARAALVSTAEVCLLFRRGRS